MAIFRVLLPFEWAHGHIIIIIVIISVRSAVDVQYAVRTAVAVRDVPKKVPQQWDRMKQKICKL